MKFYNVASWTEASETRSRWGKQTEERKKERKGNKPRAVPTPRGLAACMKTLGTAISMGSLSSLPPIPVLKYLDQNKTRDHRDNTNRIQAGSYHPDFLFLTLGVVSQGFMPWRCGSSMMMLRGGGNFKRWGLVGCLRLLVVLPSESVK